MDAHDLIISHKMLIGVNTLNCVNRSKLYSSNDLMGAFDVSNRGKTFVFLLLIQTFCAANFFKLSFFYTENLNEFFQKVIQRQRIVTRL